MVILIKMSVYELYAVGWRREIFENILKKNAAARYMARGYRDFKYVLYGNNESGPLSLRLAPQQEGYVSMCIDGALHRGV